MCDECLVENFLKGVVEFLIVVGMIGILIVAGTTKHAITSDKAQKICQQKGYQTYITYTTTFFGLKPRALVCGNIWQRMMYAQGKIDNTILKNTIENNKGIKR